MAFIHHHKGVVFLREVADLVHRGDIAVHREHAVGAYDAEPLRLRLLEAALEFRHVGIGIAIAHGLAKAYAVDNRRVIERVGDDCIIRRQERLEYAAVGVEAGRIQDRIFRVEEIRNGLFEALVDVLRAANEAHRAHAIASSLHRFLRRLDEPRVVCQPKIVVGAEIKRLRPVFEGNLRALGRCYIPFVFVEPGLFDRGQLIRKMLLEISVHTVNYLYVFKYKY